MARSFGLGVRPQKSDQAVAAYPGSERYDGEACKTLTLRCTTTDRSVYGFERQAAQEAEANHSPNLSPYTARTRMNGAQIELPTELDRRSSRSRRPCSAPSPSRHRDR